MTFENSLVSDAIINNLALEQERIRDFQNQIKSPLPLKREVPNPDPFPIWALGTKLERVANVIAETVQAPVALYGQSLLGAINLAVQPYADVAIGQRTFPISEFLLSIGESGERKSAVDKLALAPHREYERRLYLKFLEDEVSYKKLKAVFDKQWNDSLKSEKTGNSKLFALDSLPDEPKPPLQPIFLTEEPTYEGLVKLLAAGQPSLGLFADEAARLIGGHGMGVENQLKTAAGLSELWDGKRISRVRAGEGPLLMFGRRLSMHLMCQPIVAQQLLGNPLMCGQGLLSRFLVSWPTSTVGTRFYKEMNAEAIQTMDQYCRDIAAILESPVPLVEGSRNELCPRQLHLAARAKDLWISAHDDFERQLPSDGRFGSIRGFGNKAAEHALRIAATLCLFEDLHADRISEQFVEAGICLVEHYLEEVLRLHHAAAIDHDLELASKVLAWATSIEGETFHLAQLYQRGPNAVRDKKTAIKIIGILEEHNWLARAPAGSFVDGALRKDSWIVRRS